MQTVLSIQPLHLQLDFLCGWDGQLSLLQRQPSSRSSSIIGRKTESRRLYGVGILLDAPCLIPVLITFAVTIFLLVMAIIFSLPSKVFAWFEYVTSILKVVALLIFIVAGLAMVLGAGPTGVDHHGETWQNGLAFRNGFKGYGNSVLLAILAIGGKLSPIIAIFQFTHVSLDNTFTGFIAGEARSPRFSVGHAAFLIPIRVTIFYLTSVIFIGLLIKPTNENLLGGSGIAASPFVIALEGAGIRGLPDFLNVVIIGGVAAIAAESLYIASRMIRAMSHQGLIPDWVAHVDKQGRPRGAILLTSAVAILLTYLNLCAGGITVFDWLAQIATTGYFMVWVVISITSFRFRAALKAQNDPLFTEAYAWRCSFWPLPPLWLLMCCGLYAACSFYLALYPIVRHLLVCHYTIVFADMS